MRMWIVAVLTVAAVAAANTQAPQSPAPKNASGNSTPALPRELALEVELQQTKEQLAQAQNDMAALRVQFTGLSKVLDEFLSAEATPRIRAVLESRKELEAKAITALGGDPTKGDTFDWKTKTLVRKDDKK